MAKQQIPIKNFHTGVSHNEKDGLSRFVKNVNPFKDPNYLTAHKKTSKVSGSTVDGEVLWAVSGRPWNTDRYFYDASGAIYKETSGGSWSKERTVSNSSGNGMTVVNNALFYALDEGIGAYGPLSSSPSFSDDIFSVYPSLDKDDQSDTSTGNTYDVPTSISESATDKQTFTPTEEPLASITINVDTVGTSADWTVTVHNSRDESIGSKTITNGNMSTGDVVFTFSSPLRTTIAADYHFHVTVDDTTGTPAVTSGTNNDLEDANFSSQFSPLINVPYHPMVAFEGDLIIGNGEYLAKFDTVSETYDTNAIPLAVGYEVRSLARFNEFIVAAAFQGDDWENAEDAKLFFWDGIAPSFNFYSDVTVGVPNAVHNFRNEVIGVYGTKGSLYRGDDPFVPLVDVIPGRASGETVEVYPGATTVHQGRFMFGIKCTDSGNSIQQGVYEYGRELQQDEDVLNHGFTPSNGKDNGTNVYVTMVQSFGKDLYIGWRDGSSYGVDTVSYTESDSFTAATWESDILDGGSPHREKLAERLIIYFEGTSTASDDITLKYDIDRSGSFTSQSATSFNASGGTETAVFEINKRFKEIELGFDLSLSQNFPKIYEIYFEFDDLTDERSDV